MKTVEAKRLLRWEYPVLNLHCQLLRDEKTYGWENPLNLRKLRERGTDPAELRNEFAIEIAWNKGLSAL